MKYQKILLTIDCQNGFCGPEGFGAKIEESKRNEVLKNINTLIKNINYKIVTLFTHIKYTWEKNYEENVFFDTLKGITYYLPLEGSNISNITIDYQNTQQKLINNIFLNFEKYIEERQKNSLIWTHPLYWEKELNREGYTTDNILEKFGDYKFSKNWIKNIFEKIDPEKIDYFIKSLENFKISFLYEQTIYILDNFQNYGGNCNKILTPEKLFIDDFVKGKNENIMLGYLKRDFHLPNKLIYFLQILEKSLNDQLFTFQGNEYLDDLNKISETNNNPLEILEKIGKLSDKYNQKKQLGIEILVTGAMAGKGPNGKNLCVNTALEDLFKIFNKENNLGKITVVEDAIMGTKEQISDTLKFCKESQISIKTTEKILNN